MQLSGKMKQNLIKIIPFIPLFSVLILLILRPYYLSVGGGDTDFHLIRAREILINPFYGIYWDYLTYYPVGRALWHPPLFHTVFAFLWYLVGVEICEYNFCINPNHFNHYHSFIDWKTGIWSYGWFFLQECFL